MTPLTREQIAELRTLLDLARAATFRTVGVRLNNLEALLDIAEAVANADRFTAIECDHITDCSVRIPLPLGRTIFVLGLAGEVAK